MKKHKLFPHGVIEQVNSTIWQIHGSLSIPIPRVMTIVKLSDGQLLLYSVVALEEAGMQQLETIGRPAYLLVCSDLHTMDTPFYTKRYPDMVVIAATTSLKKLTKLGVTETRLPEDVLPNLEGIRYHVVPGMKCTEIVLEVDIADGGKALLFTDVFTRRQEKPSLVMKLMGPPAAVGMPRIFRFFHLTSKKQVKEFLRRMSEIEGVVLVSTAHCKNITEDCSNALKSVADSL